MKKRILSVFVALALCLGLLPVTALAVAPNGQVIYVGNENVTRGGYWTTDSDGTVTSAGNTQPGDNYIHYNANDNILTLHNATIKEEVPYNTSTYVAGAAIGVLNQSGDADLTIQLEGSNTIDEVSTGIYVLAPSQNTGSSSLTITGDGSLNASGSFNRGIGVQSNSGDATLTIQNAEVTATSAHSDGVRVQSGAQKSASLTVEGGSLTATGSGATFAGIQLQFGSGVSGSGTPTVTVSNNAIVRANGSAGGITSNSSTGVQYGTGSNTTGGIVFDGKNGTVYGDVTLQEDLEIGTDETLTIPEGASLDTNGKTITVESGGKLEGEPTGSGTVKIAPTITTESLPGGTVGEPYTETILAATGDASITWSVSNGSLPAGLSLSKDGKITGTPTTEGTSTFTVTATNNIGSDSREFTLKIEKPAFIPVTDLELNKDSLTLQENSSDTLIATVKPDDATNRGVTWESSDTSIATVSEDGTVTAISAGNATITATAADGSGISASCTLTVTHGNMIQTPKKDATCTVDGTEEYWTCEICGKHYKDESGTIQTTPEENKIQATGHSYGEPVWNWSEDGKTCTVTFTCEKDETHKETPKVKITSAVKTPATCTEAGVTTYTATVEFNGKTHTDTKDVADIPAIGHKLTKTEAKSPTSTDTGNIEYWYCKVCDKYFSDEKAEHEITLEDTIIAKLPKFVSGANQEWTKGSKDGLTFKIDTDIKEFKKVLVDGKELKDTDYDIKSGSTILTLKPSFLDTLSAGKHKIRFEFNTGSVEAYFTVKDKENSSQTESANTGVQNKYGLWIVLLLVAAGGLAGFGILSKRRKNHK